MRGRHSGLSFAFDDSPATQEHLCAVEHLYAWMFGQPDAEAVQRNHDTVIEMQMHNHANRCDSRSRSVLRLRTFLDRSRENRLTLAIGRSSRRDVGLPLLSRSIS
jgi:hypothetical protein